MGPWTILALASVPFFIVGFLLTWAIREGGSFAFLHPSRWRRAGRAPGPPEGPEAGDGR